MFNLKRILKFRLYLPLLLGMAVQSCSSSDQETSNGLQNGSISGHILLYDSAGGRVLHPATVLITAIHLSTISDSAGNWLLRNVPFGTYDVRVTSEGYDTLPYYRVTSSGGTTYLGRATLGPNPTTVPKITSVVWTRNSPSIWPLFIKGTPLRTEAMVFIDSMPGVPPHGPHMLCLGSRGGGDTTWYAYADFSTLDTSIFRHGMKLYLTACAVGDLSEIQNPSGEYPSGGGCVINPSTRQEWVISPGPSSVAFETTYPW